MARRMFSRTPHGVTTRPGASLWPPRSGGRRTGRAGGERRLRSHQVAAAIDAAVASCQAGVGRPAGRLVEALAAGVAPPAGAPVGGSRGRAPGPSGPSAAPSAASGAADDDRDGHRLVDRALARALVEAVASAWVIGWQPADLHRAVGRLRARPHAALVVRAIAGEAARHRAADLPPRWRVQLDVIGATAEGRPARGAAGDPAGGWVAGRAADRRQAVAVAIETLAALRHLPRLPKLGPAPGDAAPPPGAAAPLRADTRVLHKVTSLLAKAESTTFPDEAEALTAKAQELMTRYAIDTADTGRRAGGAGGRRLGIDDPYAGARYLLLSVVAEANRCRAVWSKYWGFATVFGDEGDLDAVELLYTSLLVQATRAMVADPVGRPAHGAGGRRGGGGRSAGGGRGGGGGGGGSGRTRSFRQSFLVAFARRIGARLAEAAEAVTAAEAGRSTALVPLFAARRAAAQEAADAAYPTIGTTRMSANDAAGWHAGTAAASRAQLDHHGALRQ